MNQTYPIVEQRSLDPARSRRVLLWHKEYREHDELPKPSAHQMLVYRVDGEYVLDSAQRKLDEEQVINATSVSVVDMTRDAEVIVQLGIPSAEASEFTMRVTFVCTVTNAVTVVREGLGDAQASLRAYLKSHHRIFELGLEYHQKQINEVRRDVNAQVKAFTTLKPPVIPGIVIELRSVEVLTPAELKQFLDSRRTIEYKHELETAEQRFGHSLTSERQHHDQWLESDRVQYEQTVAAKRQLHDQKLEWDRVRHEQGVSAESQKHELSRRADLSAYERWQRSLDREELTQLSELVGRDPQSALAYAYLAGQMGAGEMADRLEAAQHRKWDLEREERLAALDRGHQERLIELEQKSEQLRWSRERSWDEKKWRREERGYSREDERRKQEIRLEVIRELGKRGYLDMFNIDANRLLDEIAAAAPADQVERQDKPELAAGTKEPDPAAEIDDDIVVREEDVS